MCAFATEEAFEFSFDRVLRRVLQRATQECAVAIPVNRPQQPFIRGKDVCVSPDSWLVLAKEILNQVKLAFATEFIANPDTVVTNFF